MSIMFDVILIAMSIYILAGGIAGKGRLFKVNNIKEGQEENFLKYTKLIYIVLGIVMLIHSLSGLIQNVMYEYNSEQAAFVSTGKLPFLSFLSYDTLRIIGVVFFCLTLAGLGALIFVMKKFTNPDAKQNSKDPNADRQAGHTLPVDAFEFDDEPEQEQETDVQEEISDSIQESADDSRE